MSGSRSQTATILQSGIRRNASRCWSAILPQPMMATRSIILIFFELVHERGDSVAHFHFWPPAKEFVQFRVGIAIAFPFSGAATAIEYRRQLPARSSRKIFPQQTRAVSERVGDRHREKFIS